MNPKIITDPDAVPIVSLENCRKHLRVTPEEGSPPWHEDDDLIIDLLSAAREWVEGYTGLALTTRTLELALDAFPDSDGAIQLPWPPTISIESLRYVSDGAEVVIDSDSYVMDNYQRPGWLLTASGFSWPDADDVANAVFVRYVAGYDLWSVDNPTNPLPKSLRSAVLLVLGELYENREQSIERSLQMIPTGAKSLANWYRVRKGMA